MTAEAAVDAAKRAIQRATAVNLADLKRGLAGLATVGSTAPFVGLFGTTFGIINAFQGMALTGSGGLAAISAGIAEALITTAFGLFVAVPAVWAYNYLPGKVEGFNVEMDNSASRAARLLHQEGRQSRPAVPGLSSGPRRAADGGSHAMAMTVGGKKGGAIADINVTPTGGHHDRAAHHLHGDHAAAPEGHGREAAPGGEHQGKKGRAEDDHGRDQKRRHHGYLGGVKLEKQK